MPLTLTLTQGLLEPHEQSIAFKRLGEAMLRWHGLSDNPVMRRNVIGTLQVVPQQAAFAGMEETAAAFVEWKVPSFAFTDPEVQRGYLNEVSQTLIDMSGGKLSKDRVFINVIHAVDGAWNFDGVPMTNAEIGAAVSAGQP